MAKQEPIIEAQYIEGGTVDDPDLNKAFFEFMDQCDLEQNSGGTISVFRVPLDMMGNPLARTAGKTKLFSVPVGSATLDDICQRALNDYIDHGQYRMFIQVMATQDGKSGIRFNRIIGMEKPRNESRALTVASGAPSMKEILDLIDKRAREAEARTESLLREILTARMQPQTNSLDSSLAMMEKLGGIAAIMAGRGPAPAPAPAENMMQQFMSTMMMKMMERMMDSPMMGGTPAKEEGFSSIIKEIAKVAGPMMAGALEDKRIAATREQRLLLREKAAVESPAPEETEKVSASSVDESLAGASSQNAADESTTAPDSTNNEENPVTQNPPDQSDGKIRLFNELHSAMPLIIQAAVRNADANQCADLLMKAIPEDDEEMNAALFDLVMAPTWFEELCSLDTDIAAHRPWFEKLRDAIVLQAQVDGVTGE